MALPQGINHQGGQNGILPWLAEQATTAISYAFNSIRETMSILYSNIFQRGENDNFRMVVDLPERELTIIVLPRPRFAIVPVVIHPPRA